MSRSTQILLVSSLVLLVLFVGAGLLGPTAARADAAPTEAPNPPVIIRPGLVAHHGPSQVLPPELPFQVGMGRISATIDAIEWLALTTADTLPELAPTLSRGPAERQVWVVHFRGRIRANLPGYVITDPAHPVTHGFYLVADRSGSWYGLGAAPGRQPVPGFGGAEASAAPRP